MVMVSSQPRDVCDLLTLCGRPSEIIIFFFLWGFLKRDKFWKAQDGKSELFQQISHPKSQTDVQLTGAHVPTLANAQWITNSWSSEVPKSVPRKTHLCVLHSPMPIEGREISFLWNTDFGNAVTSVILSCKGPLPGSKITKLQRNLLPSYVVVLAKQFPFRLSKSNFSWKMSIACTSHFNQGRATRHQQN